MNYALILKVLSLLFAIMASAFSICAGLSAWNASTSVLEGEALPAWISIIALSVLLAFAFFLPSRTAKGKLFKKDALCIVGIGWTTASLLGAVPYIMILDVPFSVAFFESTSGLTTTGASVFDNFADFPESLMFWRCLSHWIGGLGVIVFFVAILSFLGSDGRTLYSNEASANSGGGVETERIRTAIIKIIGIYLLISISCLACFKFCGMGWFDGICHMFSTVATGGFSVYENSISHYNSNLIYWIVAFFMFVGGISFPLMILIWRGNLRRALQNTEFATYVIILLIASVAITTMLYSNAELTLSDSLTYATFSAVSVMTTTGYMCADYGAWIPMTSAILFALMMIGGCSGSTSGGIKVSRLIVSFNLCKSHIEKSFRPHVVRSININGKVIDDKSAYDVLSYITLFSLIALASVVIVSVLEPSLSLEDAITAALASLNNIGPGFGKVGPAENYGFVSASAKIFLSILMIMGRLEFYAILALFMPSVWKKFE